MPATKQQQTARLAAARQIIADSGGQVYIDTEGAELHRQMVSQMVLLFANEGMKKDTASRYIDRALNQFRGEEFRNRRGGHREGGGRPTGSRKCQNCGTWNMAVSPNGEKWQCSKCGAIHPAQVKFLMPGDTFDI